MLRSLVASNYVRVRRDVRGLVTVALMMVLMAPVFFGPATGLLVRAIGGEVEHQCACGMKRGTCGCPECAKLEHDRKESKNPAPYCALKSSCDDDETPGLGALPPAVPATRFVVHRVAYVAMARPCDPPVLASADAAPPETPPPRHPSA